MGGVLTVRVVRLQRILPPPPPQASHNGCSGKRGMSPGTHLQGRQAGLGDPRGGAAGPPRQKRAGPTGSTLPFSLRTGTAPAVDWMGGCFMRALGTDMVAAAAVIPET